MISESRAIFILFRMLALSWLVDAITPTRSSQWVGTMPTHYFSSRKQPTFKRQPQIYFQDSNRKGNDVRETTRCILLLPVTDRINSNTQKVSRQDIQNDRKSPFIKKESRREKYQTMKFQIKSITVLTFYKPKNYPRINDTQSRRKPYTQLAVPR